MRINNNKSSLSSSSSSSFGTFVVAAAASTNNKDDDDDTIWQDKKKNTIDEHNDNNNNNKEQFFATTVKSQHHPTMPSLSSSSSSSSFFCPKHCRLQQQEQQQQEQKKTYKQSQTKSNSMDANDNNNDHNNNKNNDSAFRICYLILIHNERTIEGAIHLFRAIRHPNNIILIHVDVKARHLLWEQQQETEKDKNNNTTTTTTTTTSSSLSPSAQLLWNEITYCTCGSRVRMEAIHSVEWGTWSMNLPTLWGLQTAIQDYGGNHYNNNKNKEWHVFINLSGDSLPVYTPETTSYILSQLSMYNIVTSSSCATGLHPTPVIAFSSWWHKRQHYTEYDTKLNFIVEYQERQQIQQQHDRRKQQQQEQDIQQDIQQEQQEQEFVWKNQTVTIYFGSQWVIFQYSFVHWFVQEWNQSIYSSFPHQLAKQLQESQKLMADETFWSTLLMHTKYGIHTLPRLSSSSSSSIQNYNNNKNKNNKNNNHDHKDYNDYDDYYDHDDYDDYYDHDVETITIPIPHATTTRTTSTMQHQVGQEEDEEEVSTSTTTTTTTTKIPSFLSRTRNHGPMLWNNGTISPITALRYERMDEHGPIMEAYTGNLLLSTKQRYKVLNNNENDNDTIHVKPWGPYYLGIYDLQSIRQSGSLYIRKVSSLVDENLYRVLPVSNFIQDVPIIGWPRQPQPQQQQQRHQENNHKNHHHEDTTTFENQKEILLTRKPQYNPTEHDQLIQQWIQQQQNKYDKERIVFLQHNQQQQQEQQQKQEHEQMTKDKEEVQVIVDENKINKINNKEMDHDNQSGELVLSEMDDSHGQSPQEEEGDAILDDKNNDEQEDEEEEEEEEEL